MRRKIQIKEFPQAGTTQVQTSVSAPNSASRIALPCRSRPVKGGFTLLSSREKQTWDEVFRLLLSFCVFGFGAEVRIKVITTQMFTYQLVEAWDLQGGLQLMTLQSCEWDYSLSKCCNWCNLSDSVAIKQWFLYRMNFMSAKRYN